MHDSGQRIYNRKQHKAILVFTPNRHIIDMVRQSGSCGAKEDIKLTTLHFSGEMIEH